MRGVMASVETSSGDIVGGCAALPPYIDILYALKHRPGCAKCYVLSPPPAPAPIPGYRGGDENEVRRERYPDIQSR